MVVKYILKGTFMEILLLAFLVILYTLQSLLTKLYTDKYPGDPGVASTVLTVVSGLSVAAVTFFGFSLCSFTLNWWSVIIGTLNAFALFGYNHFIVKSSQTGPYSVVMMFNLSGGIIIPIIIALVVGWDAWEAIPEIIINVISIAAIIGAVYMVSVRADEGEKSKASIPFMLSCFGLGICNGLYGTFLTLQQRTSAAGGEVCRNEMIIVTFLVAAIISAVSGFLRQGRGFVRSFKQNKTSALFLVATSLVFALAINVVVIIIPLIPTTILYTFDNSSVLILSVLISWLFFREKLSRLNVIGIAVMVSALTCMNLLPILLT